MTIIRGCSICHKKIMPDGAAGEPISEGEMRTGEVSHGMCLKCSEEYNERIEKELEELRKNTQQEKTAENKPMENKFPLK